MSTYTGTNLTPIDNGLNWYLDTTWAQAPSGNVVLDTAAADQFAGSSAVWKVTLVPANAGVDYGGIAVQPGEVIVFMCYIKTSAATLAADVGNPQAGGRIGMDVYGSKGRITSIQTPNGTPSVSTNTNNTYVVFGTNTYTLVTIAFTLASQYASDGASINPYPAGQMVTPTAVIPWLEVWSDTQGTKEGGTAWFANPTFYINPSTTTPITPTYLLNWAITPTSGILPFTIAFSGYLSRSSNAVDTGTIVNGETIQLQVLAPGSTTWTNTGVTATTVAGSLGQGYFSGTWALAEPTINPGTWQFRSYYPGNTSKNLGGCDAPFTAFGEKEKAKKKRNKSNVNALIL